MRYPWHHAISVRDYSADDGLIDRHERLSPTLLELIRDEASPQRRVIEVGCGVGQLTLAIAPLFEEVIALDWSETALAEARLAVARHGITNVQFHLADAEQANYRTLAGDQIHLVVAHLCVSNAIVAQAACLDPGTILAVAAFHTDQWYETGIISRFAYSEAAMEAVLDDTGFHPCYLGLEKESLRFSSLEVALGYLEKTGLKAKWRSSERWSGFLQYLHEGGDSLTVRSRVVAKALRK